MDVTIEFDDDMATTLVLISLEDNGGIRVRVSRRVDVETLLALDRDIARRVVAAIQATQPPG